jgi:5-(carboxyamino)imidazole ribonucleotide synthase
LESFYDKNPVIGILGGGQLGRMLIQSGIDFNLDFRVLDPDPSAPCASLARFQVGSLTDYETVLSLGRNCELITIEIENVNTSALHALREMGKVVYPQPEVIELIQDKRTQKCFFRDNSIPTAEFILTRDREAVYQHREFLPAVHKLGREGYDGRGVQVLNDESDMPKAFNAPGLLEKFVAFEKELSIVVARNERGDVVSYPPVEMIFHPVQNLVEYLFAPAALEEAAAIRADALARKVITDLKLVGLLAVEMFLTTGGDVLVNEVAPRPHNSGHQTIEANVTSQYEQHLRAILNLPLGDTTLVHSSAMVNLLGEPGHEGVARYEGLEKVLEMPGVHVHLYGKKLTKPFRKMGHVTIVDKEVASLRRKAEIVKQSLKVISS